MRKSIHSSTTVNDMYHHHDDFPIKTSFASNHAITVQKLTSSSSLPLSQQPPLQLQQSQQPQRWSVGKISILILAFISLTDIILSMVDAQMEYLEAPDHYDALSADVIRPAFRYYHQNVTNESSQHRRNHSPYQRRSMGLGSAAISSVTTALSPILPFTGGIDLRREDYWTNGWWGSLSSIAEQVQKAFAKNTSSSVDYVVETPRGGAAVSKKKKRDIHPNRNFIFSSSEPFAPLKEIADLTLQDVATSFRFAAQNTRRDFQSNKFMAGLLPRAKKVVDRMSNAVATARGKGVIAPITGDDNMSVASGDIDALSFCAAMRIFAEWRVLRQVPPGYKGYAVGMTLGQKDIVQNIAKIEQAIQNFVDHLVAVNDDVDQVSSPTLRQLLQYEVDADIQDVSKLPRLKEKSAAMGLLWVRRQLQYQTAIFANVMEVPHRYESTRAAVQSAYDEVYNRYHGWAVQKIFSYSFQAAPDATEIYKFMDPHELAQVQRDAHDRFVGDEKRSGVPNFRRFSETASDNPFQRFGRHVGKEWNKFAGNVVQGWENAANGLGQLFGQRPTPAPVIVTTSVPPLTTTTSVAAHPSRETDRVAADVPSSSTLEQGMESFVNQEMERNAYAHIRSYLEVANPLLQDLESLFDEFNMNDPTKV